MQVLTTRTSETAVLEAGEHLCLISVPAWLYPSFQQAQITPDTDMELTIADNDEDDSEYNICKFSYGCLRCMPVPQTHPTPCPHQSVCPH